MPTEQGGVPEEAVEWYRSAAFAVAVLDCINRGISDRIADLAVEAAAPALRKLHREEFEEELLSDEALRAFDQALPPIFNEDDLPALPDYRRAQEAALSSIAPPMPKRTEYRLLFSSYLPECYRRETSDRTLIEAGLRLAEQRGVPSRIQTRTVTETPWTDLENPDASR